MSKRNTDGSVRLNIWEHFYDYIEQNDFVRCEEMMESMKESDGIYMTRRGMNVLLYSIYIHCNVLAAHGCTGRRILRMGYNNLDDIPLGQM